MRFSVKEFSVAYAALCFYLGGFTWVLRSLDPGPMMVGAYFGLVPLLAVCLRLAGHAIATISFGGRRLLRVRQQRVVAKSLLVAVTTFALVAASMIYDSPFLATYLLSAAAAVQVYVLTTTLVVLTNRGVVVGPWLSEWNRWRIEHESTGDTYELYVELPLMLGSASRIELDREQYHRAKQIIDEHQRAPTDSPSDGVLQN